MTCAMQKPEFSEQLPERFPELMGTHMKDFHLPLHWGFQRGVFARGENLNNWGGCAHGFAIINFAFFVRGFLVESYINSEIFTGI